MTVWCEFVSPGTDPILEEPILICGSAVSILVKNISILKVHSPWQSELPKAKWRGSRCRHVAKDRCFP